jgi:hypothetical protein
VDAWERALRIAQQVEERSHAIESARMTPRHTLVLRGLQDPIDEGEIHLRQCT